MTNQRFRNEEMLKQGYSNIPDQGVRFGGPHPWDVWVVSDPPDDVVIPDLIKREDGVITERGSSEPPTPPPKDDDNRSQSRTVQFVETQRPRGNALSIYQKRAVAH